MRAIMIMYDSLNRNLLPAYGCDWTKLPGFRRLEERCVVFDNFYAGSLPCMPARRELHTGRYNFLHRSWGPMEPFDESCIGNLTKRGIHTHLSTDHLHYWEDGGVGYHTKYCTWDQIRGQEGDAWIGQVREPEIPESYSRRSGMELGTEKYRKWRQDWVNRSHTAMEEARPQTVTFQCGLDFIRENADQDNWFLQIESFDPHEPFYSMESYQALYPHDYKDKHMDWPDYGENELDEAVTHHIKCQYAALLSMCDRNLQKVLDVMDERDMWKDTMLIVNTDHGFMLGEKNWMGKNFHPLYNEISRLPFFIYDPRYPNPGRREALAQTIDIAPTLLDFFEAEPLEYVQGKNLDQVLAEDKPIREAGVFGMFGKGINVTDGTYVYMHGFTQPDNKPLYEYTLMPTHMNCYFREHELQDSQLCDQFDFARGCKVLQIESSKSVQNHRRENRLFDLNMDSLQEKPLNNPQMQKIMLEKMRRVMITGECPAEQFVRLGIPEEGDITLELIEELNRRGEMLE